MARPSENLSHRTSHSAAKDHGRKKVNGLLSAMILYGQDFGRRVQGMTEGDFAYLREHVDQQLLEQFSYHLPKEVLEV